MEGTTTIEGPPNATELRERIARLERALAERECAEAELANHIHGILGVHFDLTDRDEAEHALRKSCELLKEHVQQRTAELVQEKEHLRNLLEVHERERRLIGFEIHDGLAQFLAGAMMHLGNFRRMVDQDDAGAWNSFDVATGLLARSLREARRLIHDLRPPELEEGGIQAAIEGLVWDAREQWGLEIELVYEVQFERLAPPLEHAIYRVVQEALMNACRHSESQQVRILLCQKGARLRICVEDWGIGFDPGAVEEGHYGLEGIRERARIFAGEVTVDSQPGWGTALSVVLPLSGAKVAPALLVNHY